MRPDILNPLFAEVEEIVHAGPQLELSVGEDSRIMTEGARRLGYRYAVNQRNQEACVGSNNCTLGCPTGAKQSTLAGGTDVDDAIIRGGLNYLLHISETSEFEQRLITEIGDENTYTESVTALRARIIGELAIVLSYTIKNNSDVPAGIEKTDTFTAISVEYAF